VDAVTANSRPAADYIVDVVGLPPDTVHYLPNGIDLDTWDRRAAGPSPFEVDDTRLDLALIGRFSAEKNHRMLLDAVSRLDRQAQRSLRLWFVGGDQGPPNFRAKVREAISRADLAAEVRVEPPTLELPAFLASIDGLVLPSSFEGFPNVVMEAMASRLPVLASRVGDVPSMIDDGRTGLLVDANDPDALLAGLRRFLTLDADSRRTLGEAARSAIESRYRIEAVAADHLALYRRLAGGLHDADRAVGARGMG